MQGCCGIQAPPSSPHHYYCHLHSGPLIFPAAPCFCNEWLAHLPASALVSLCSSYLFSTQQTPILPGHECDHRPLPSAPGLWLVYQALQIWSSYPLQPHLLPSLFPRAQCPGSPGPTTSQLPSPQKTSTHSKPALGLFYPPQDSVQGSSSSPRLVWVPLFGSPRLQGFLPLWYFSPGTATLASLTAVTKPLALGPIARAVPHSCPGLIPSIQL